MSRITDAMDVLVQDFNSDESTMSEILEETIGDEVDSADMIYIMRTAEFAAEHYVAHYSQAVGPHQSEAVYKAALGAIFTLGMRLGHQIGYEDGVGFTRDIDLTSLQDD